MTLAGLARDTNTIRLGTLMTSATFRYPGPLAISVAQVDQMSGGRVELGIGAGWFEAEHTAYGIPFLEVRERFERLEEIPRDRHGAVGHPDRGAVRLRRKHYRVADSGAAEAGAVAAATGAGRRSGKRRTPALAALYADEFNVPFHSVSRARAVRAGA